MDAPGATTADAGRRRGRRAAATVTRLGSDWAGDPGVGSPTGGAGTAATASRTGAAILAAVADAERRSAERGVAALTGPLTGPLTEPGPTAESAFTDESPTGAAQAAAMPPVAIPAPTPSATASPPMRPTEADARISSKLYLARGLEQRSR